MGQAVTSSYYGPQNLDDSTAEWLDPREAPVDVEEVPPPDETEEEPATTHFTEPYSGIVGGVDYGRSRRPGSDPYQQTNGRLTPWQIDCLPKDKGGCEAKAGEKCTFVLERVTKSYGGVRRREEVTGTRRMPCVVRIREADKT